MKTPKFWLTDNLISRLLLPIGAVYGFVTQWRLKHHKPHRVKAKVICIGNITAGGVGKTPVAIAVANYYLNAGRKVFFVTRGYKGKLKNVLVDIETQTPAETGDEARLLAAVAPTIIAPKREIGAEMAVSLGAEIIIMDDGFQNPGLYKDEAWLVFDGSVGIGNGRIIPAGPLRETLATGQARADRILIMGEDKTHLAEKCSLPVSFGYLEPYKFELENKRVFAFAGIGHPEKFYQTLQTLGYDVVETRDFADHHIYTSTDIAELKALAAAKNLALVTTEKDFVKIGCVWEGIYCLRIQAKLGGLV